MTDVLYFGCIDRVGHYLWVLAGGRPCILSGRDPRYRMLSRFDGLLCPADATEGVAIRHDIHGYGVLAYWDRSVDSRPGSSSVFFVKGSPSNDELLTAAQQVFPWVFERINGRFTVRLQQEEPPCKP